MQQETWDQVTDYERRLMRAIEDLKARIKELQEEQDALQRQLLRARWERHSLRDVSRKNSGDRVMVEEKVLDALRRATRPVTSSKLFTAAQFANFELKENTFRTYLHRMKKRGLIENVGRGKWKLSDTHNLKASGS